MLTAACAYGVVEYSKQRQKEERAKQRALFREEMRAKVDEILASMGIVVYVTNWCPVCARARDWLSDVKLRYQERDIDRSEEALIALLQINPRRTVPTFDIEGQVVVGLSQYEVLSAVDAFIRRKTNGAVPSYFTG